MTNTLPSAKINDPVFINVLTKMIEESNGAAFMHLLNCDKQIIINTVWLRNCSELKALPKNLKVNGSLRLVHCKEIKHLPKKLYVTGCLDLEGCDKIKEIRGQIRAEEIRIPDHLEKKDIDEHLWGVCKKYYGIDVVGTHNGWKKPGWR